MIDESWAENVNSDKLVVDLYRIAFILNGRALSFDKWGRFIFL